MKTRQQQASARLFKKLSALRATLPNDERVILDSLIIVDDVPVNSRAAGRAGEVQAHKLTGKAIGKAASKTTAKGTEVQAHKLTNKAVGKAATKTTTKATEVQAHKLTNKAVGKAVNKTTTNANEVQAHKLTIKTTSKTTNKATDKTTPRIAFDLDTEEYKIQE